MEHVESMKMILGEMGIKILKVLRLGAMDMKAINFLSGVPMACVKGRIPVLKSLNMIKETEATYSLDKEGEQFLKRIGSSDEF
jgi:predicted transcriptional regulator